MPSFIFSFYARFVHALHKLSLPNHSSAFIKRQFLNFITHHIQSAWRPENYPLWYPNVYQRMNNLDFWPGMMARLQPISSYTLGESIACTEGWVLERKPLYELIYYPSSSVIKGNPIVLVPSWINKFYILDLEPSSSVIAWLNQRGYPVYTISWLNPQHPIDQTFEDYAQAVLRSIEHIQCSHDSVHLVGYCAGGMLISWAAVHMPSSYLKSLTYLNSMFDFRYTGDWRFFMQQEWAKRGLLSRQSLRQMFMALRVQECFWQPLIDYYQGNPRRLSALQHWSDDGMNMDLRLYHDIKNLFFERNIFYAPRDVKHVCLCTIKTPVFILGSEKDHLCPWWSCYRGLSLFSSPTTFVLSHAGHVSSILNVPQKNKYGYSLGERYMGSPLEWRQHSTSYPGSWWSYWMRWIDQYNGNILPQPKVQSAEAAPGLYARL